MNKTIQKLAEQAGMTHNNNVVDLEKFAELIVQACISEIAMLALSNCDNPDICWAVDTACKNIKNRLEDM